MDFRKSNRFLIYREFDSHGEKIGWLDKKKNETTKEIKNYEDKIKELINLDNPSRELLQSIIDKIVIDKDRNIEIFYKFSLLNDID